MLIRVVRMTFRPEKVETFLANFEANKHKIRSFPGCHRLELLQDWDNPAVFASYSYWDDDEALNAYRHSPLFKGIWAKTKPLFAEKPAAWSYRQKMVVEV